VTQKPEVWTIQTKLSLLCEKVIEAGWLAALILVPLFFNIYSARTFEPDKLTLMRSIALVMALAWLIKVAETGVISAWSPGGGEGRAEARQGIRKLLDIPLFLPTMLLVLAYLISTIFSISPLVSLWGSYQRLQGTYTALSYIVIFALMATHLRSRAQVDRLVTTIILTSLPVGLYGIIQHYGLDPLPWAGDVTLRVASSLGNAIFVASYLVMAAPLTLARLLDSMESILNDEDASWGHTVLAAVYIFILAVDLITVIFSKSRGPLLGLLAGLFFFTFLGLLNLYRRREKGDVLNLGSGLRSLLETIALLALGGVLGGVGFRLVGPVSVGQARMGLWALVAAGILLGVILNVLLIALQAALRRGWSRLWVNWVLLAVFMAGFLVSLNVPGSPFLSVRSLPTVGRLTELFQPGEGTGRVRVLIWDGVLRLITPHEPIGIPGEFSDGFNVLRPLIGYGPESMFNSFAKVYPPELAHVEKRGSSADRSHNETFDSLAMMGVIGFAAYYFLMFSLFYYLLKAVGWIPDASARRRLLVLLGLGGVLGVLLPPLMTGNFVFSGLGLPAGMLLAMFAYLVWQALVSAREETGTDAPGSGETATQMMDARDILLLMGVFAALVAHFVEVHFVFSIAATYVYFWAYAGMVVAWTRWSSGPEDMPVLAAEVAEPHATASAPQPASQRRRRRRRKQDASSTSGPAVTAKGATGFTGYEDWETWLGVLGLVVAIILIAMVFDFVTTQFDISRGSFSMLWMFGIVWGLGLAVALGEVAIRGQTWRKSINWGRAFLLYTVTSLGYSSFYLMIHRWQIRPRNLASGADPLQAVISGARVYTGAFLSFYLFVGILVILIAAMLAIPFLRRQPAWRAANWWLYPVLILATGAGIFFKNVDVVRADMFLKQGEQYRSQGQYDSAIALHQRSIQFDPDEDFYYLMLALDYQLKGQDSRISAEAKAQAWAEGERVAQRAREINPYNPDNTGNLGRYYLTWAQMSAPDDPQRAARFQSALEYFEKATKLAPQNVVYYNLWAQTYYVLGQFDRSAQILQTSIALDPEFDQTQMLLGDTYAAMGRPAEALKAHRAAILLTPAAFADQFLDQRLNFYLSASQPLTDSTGTVSGQDVTPIEGIISAYNEAQTRYPTSVVIPRTLGHIYARLGDQSKAVEYYQQAIQMGDTDVQTVLAMADMYLGLKDYEQAAKAYQLAIQRDPQNLQAHSNLGYVYAQLGHSDEAIQENLRVLQLNPNDYVSHRNLALLYRDSGRLDEAINEAQRVVEVAPENELGTAYVLLGSLYEASGQPDAALEAYQQAVGAAPDLFQAQAALGNLYLKQGRLEDALHSFQTVAQLRPDDYTVHQQLALLYRQLRRYDEALSEANQALALAPADMQESLKTLVAQIEGEKS
jgi:tetratricopeptide (TPR) repeat protein